jgi:prolyl-tRNA editing enzyme YbaK/EbsC (Cys-tRNA(Pro) deacylase)
VTEDRDPLQRVRQKLRSCGIEATIRQFDQGAHTAADAASAVGCEVAQIAKSIVFDTSAGPLIVVASGVNRINKRLVGDTIGLKLHSVGPDYLRERLSLEPGGVSPLAVDPEVRTIIDDTLLRFDRIWLSAGTPSHLLDIDVVALAELCHAQITAICEDQS